MKIIFPSRFKLEGEERNLVRSGEPEFLRAVERLGHIPWAKPSVFQTFVVGPTSPESIPAHLSELKLIIAS